MSSAIAQEIILPVSQLHNSFMTYLKGPKKPKKILMIEDDPEIALIMRRSLKRRYNCTVDVAQDPFEAINCMVEKFYDLIILDWQLPGMNGTETLVEAEKGLKFEPSIPIQWDKKKVPVVIFSSATKRSECTPRRTKHFDYVGFITKTQPLDEIVEMFGEYISEDYVPTKGFSMNRVINYSA
jgi:CheY-like chemotaxis protein